MSFIRSFSIAAVLAVGVASVAVAQSPAAPRTPSPRADARPGKGAVRPPHAPRPPRQRAGRGLLQGITLSDAQRSQLQAIHQQYGREVAALRAPLAAERRAGSDAAGAGRAAMRQRMQADSAARRAMRERTRPDSARRAVVRRQLTAVRQQSQALQQRELTEVRALLTAEQQRTFDANRRQMTDRAAEWRQRRGPGAAPGATGSREPHGGGRGRVERPPNG